MGITNELFQTERDETSTCQFASLPNSVTNTDGDDAPRSDERDREIRLLHALPRAADAFVRYAGRGRLDCARPRRCSAVPGARSAIRRRSTTGNCTVAALRNQAANLFSDLLVHDMGAGAGRWRHPGPGRPSEFRTAPLWGLGQRIFFLHDGRTSDLLEAIRAHRAEPLDREPPKRTASSGTSTACGKPEAGPAQLPSLAVAGVPTGRTGRSSRWQLTSLPLGCRGIS